MDTTTTDSDQATQTLGAGMLETKLEVVIIPVSDVDRAKRFYQGLGFRLDADFVFSDDFRALQLTPPGSQASIIFGKGVTPAAPGSAQGMMLAVDDIHAARAELIARGAEVSEVYHGGSFFGAQPRAAGPDPERRSYSSYASFTDPDGNGWLLQEVTKRLPGRVVPTQAELASLTELLREAELRHGAYEATAPKHHWSDWYAGYVAARQSGKTPDEAASDATLRMGAVGRAA